jgi:hypothetical protein
MEILAQHGYGCGDRVTRGLDEGLIDGVIFGAKDIGVEKLKGKIAEVRSNHPNAKCLFDPQFYAAIVAGQNGARLGSLVGSDPYPYFEPRRRRDLEREQVVIRDLQAVLEFQHNLDVTAAIAPSIVIPQSLNSAHAVIAKDFLRNARGVWDGLGGDKPLYATLAISSTALSDKSELEEFLEEITEIEARPEGFYLLLEKPDGAIPDSLTERNELSRWMLVNHTLKLNGFELINGYTDLLAPYLGATGADAVASGWFNTLKSFSLKKFEPTESFARRPVPRYSSAALLKSIRHTELQNMRDLWPQILNDEPTDAYYDPEYGSSPEGAEEALQNWGCLKKLCEELISEGDVADSVNSCREALDYAGLLYAEFNQRGITLREKSSMQHVGTIRDELEFFEEMAEL